MARNEQLIRQHRLLQMLERSRFGRTLAELRESLVEELGLDQLSERTVRRDLEALQAAGFDVDSQASERGTTWTLGPTLKGIRDVPASATELLALSMGRDMLAPLAGTPFWQGIESLWNKMRENLPEGVWKHFEQRRSTLVVRGSPAKNYADKKGILDTLNRAIVQHRVVEIEYLSAGAQEAKTRNILPYTLVLYRGSIYLIAADENDPPEQALRHWKLDRFTKATTLDVRFKPREDFDPEEHFAHSLGVYKAGSPITAKIKIAAEAAAWVMESPWAPNQEVTTLPSGDAELTLREVYETEIGPRVLSLGGAAEVLEPADFRERMREQLERMAAAYQQRNDESG
jgi:predicted DNA-binding transcriptional regulator YafY